jgi:hypothetical protein
VDWAWEKLRRAGAIVGSEEGQQLAPSANRHLPELRTHDRFGHRIDQVEFHPAYHELMRLIFSTETHSLAWTDEGRPGAHVARAALSYLWNQGENGVCCPMGMTFASIAALRNNQGHACEVAREDPLAHLCRSDRARPSRTTAAPATAADGAEPPPHRRDQRRAPGTPTWLCPTRPQPVPSLSSPFIRRSSRCSLGGEPSTAS